MLTRDLIASGRYLDLLESGGKDGLWSMRQIEASLEATLAARPAESAETWVFAYGSLIWNPMIHYDARAWATLPGWRRCFNLRMTLGRGSEARPGRMLAIEPADGAIRGVALRIPPARLREELDLLWRREMLTGAYEPAWATVGLDDGRQVAAIIFASNPRHPAYEKDHSVVTVAPLVAQAYGPYGSNAEYVLRLQQELWHACAADEDVEALAQALRRHMAQREGG